MYRIPRLALMVILVSLGGCSGGETGAPVEMRTVVDDLGRTVEVPENPRRVVTLAPSLTEVVFAAGGGERIAAVTTADDYPPAVNEKERIGAFPLNHEAVVAQKPDLILASDQVNSPLDLEPLADLGIPAIFFRFSKASDVIASVRRTGELLKTSTHANAAADSLQARWERIGPPAEAPSDRPRLLLLVGYDVLYAFGGDSYTTEMIYKAGAVSVTAELAGQSAVLSDEFVVASAPDFLVVSSKSEVTREALLELHPAWDVVPAIRSDRVYAIDPDLVLRPGPRIIEGTERLAAFITRESGGRSR